MQISAGDRVTVTVVDSGSGFSAGHQRHIFNAFHRGGQGDGTARSVDLGLHVANHLASLLGANLR